MCKWLSTQRWVEWRLNSPGVIWAVVTSTIAFAGPFGTYTSLPFLSRVVFWGVPLFVLTAVAFAARALLADRFGIGDFPRRAFLTAVAVGLASAPVCRGMYALYGLRAFAPLHIELVVFFFLTALGTGALLRSLTGQDDDPEPIDAATLDQMPIHREPAEVAQPRLMQRLPDGMRGPLLHVSVRNHYVDVITDKGKTEILMRLSDAIAETAPQEGAQVHRSHWVAWSAIQSYHRESQRQYFVLTNGTIIPVSRTYRDFVEQRFSGTQIADAERQSTANAPVLNNAANAASELGNPPV